MKNKKIYLLLVCFVFWIVFPVHAWAAESLTSQSFGDMTVTAETIALDVQNEIFYAEAKVRVTGDDLNLTCDKMVYYAKEERMKAEGDVTFTQNEVTVLAETLDYDLKKNEQLFTKIKIIYGKWNFSGESMEMKPGKLIIRNARMSMCDKNHYQYIAKRVEITNWEEIYTKGTWLKVLGKTVAPLPNIHIDLKSGKAWSSVIFGVNQKNGVGLGTTMRNPLTSNLTWGTNVSLWTKGGVKTFFYLEAKWANDIISSQINTASRETPYMDWKWQHNLTSSRWDFEFEHDLDGEWQKGYLSFSKNFIFGSNLQGASGVGYKWDSGNVQSSMFISNEYNWTISPLFHIKALGSYNINTGDWEDSAVTLYRALHCVEVGITHSQETGWGLTAGLKT